MPRYTRRSLYHGWLPQHPEVHAEFLRRNVASYSANAPPPRAATSGLDQAITDLINVMRASPYTDLMFRQVNKDKKWAPDGFDYHVQNLQQLDWALRGAVRGPPDVYVVKKDGKAIGEPVGIPIYLVLDLLINTGAAYDLFRTQGFNDAMKKMLDEWAKYLNSETSGSNSTLNNSETGWFGPHGLEVLQQGLKGYSFEQTYGVSPAQAQEVYKSWDKFFIRDILNFKQLRPVLVPDLYTAIHNACESTTVRIVPNVKVDDTFWLKGQNYSLWDMLGGNATNSLAGYADRFLGGAVYQAFLAPSDYHHWHSPIKGTILDTAVIPGTYYAALPDDGAPKGNVDHLREGDPHGALMRSQPWLSVSAARGVIIIEPPKEDNSPIDLIGFIGIGMVEVSTIDIRVSKQDNVEAGGHLGMFHFGGSSHTVIVKLKDSAKYGIEWKDFDGDDIKPEQHRWVNEIIGHVVKTA